MPLRAAFSWRRSDLAGVIEDLDLAVVDAHRDLAVERRRQGRVVGAVHLHEPGIIDGALALLEEAEARGGQRLEVRPLLAEHLEHLALLAAVDARRRPALLPVREPRVLRLDGLEAPALERRGLGMLDRVLDGPLAVRVPDAAGIGYHAVVGRAAPRRAG